jgi:hypothetical protein
MKYLRLLIIYIVLLGAVFVLWKYSAPSSMGTAVTPPQTPPPAAAQNAMTPSLAPPKPATTPIAPPVVNATIKAVAAQPLPPVAPGPQPQANLNDCIAQTLKLLQAKDVLGLVKTLMPPSAMQAAMASGQFATLDDVAAMYANRPTINQQLSHLQQILESVKDQTPVLNPDGSQATYKIDPSVGSYTGPGASDGGIAFVKEDGFWYLK